MKNEKHRYRPKKSLLVELYQKDQTEKSCSSVSQLNTFTAGARDTQFEITH